MIKNIFSQQKLLFDLIAKTSKSQLQQDEHELLRAAVAINLHPIEVYIQQLHDLMKERRDKLVKLERNW